MRPSPAVIPVLKPASARKRGPVLPVDFDAVTEALRAAGHGPGEEAGLMSRFCRPVAVRVLADHAHAVSAALTAMGVRPGGYCVVSALACSETLAGVVAAGLKPWLVDVDPFSWMFDPSHLRERLPEAPGPLEAILPAGAHGRAPDLRAWAAFRDETGLPILVEAVEAFDVIQSAPVPVIVGLPSGHGVFVACEDATPIVAMETPLFEGEAGLNLWPQKRPRLATAAQRLRVLLLDAPIGFQPGWGMSWVSETCALSLPDDTAPAVLSKLAEAGVEAIGASFRTRDMDADETPVADRLASSVVVIRLDPDLGLQALDDIAAVLRSAVAG
ncbi:DegT/DnrJ/EryC1/StrS family aminotransferase [Caulobacter sp. DWR1-3-2b1]|uniref:DegT/DnrJ/EryC1/StrS family aminotransferase n=1 Tax=Caulobacter sp. DWR1-3-2b1 TaxID=2804670 RepID=UPI003CEA860F